MQYEGFQDAPIVGESTVYVKSSETIKQLHAIVYRNLSVSLLHTDHAIRRAETRGSTGVLSTRRVRDGGYLREGRRTWEDFAPPELSFPRLLQEAFGKEDAAAIQDALNRAIH